MFLSHIYLIPLFPALGAALMFFFGRKLRKPTVNAVCVGSVVLAFLMSCGAVLEYTTWAAEHHHQPYEKILYTWLGTDTGHLNYLKSDGTEAPLQADAGFLLDPLSSIWLLFVTGVGMLIHIYSTGYMAHEGGYYRFFGYLNLFMFSMLTLILANNYVLMFVGWEGVGLCSYLLIGFYFHRKSASDAANKAFIVNRIGDAGFLLGIFFIAWYMGSLRFIDVTHAARSGQFAIGDPIITAATLLLFVGACGNSAQLPLYVWLPDAMEGPTPVSALIHAATMVTAGVYMVARTHVLFDHSPFALSVVAIVGAATAIFAATIGLVQNDIKRVLAYSTISQLGYMFLACGVAAYSAGIFHLVTHAFFKALLFLAAGSVIHGLGGEQDLRKMGGLWKKLPVTFAVATVGVLAIAGIFPFAGFFSKDAILYAAFLQGTNGRVLWFVGVVTALLTSFYMFRLWYLAFLGKSRSEEVHPHESPWSMRGPLVILALLSICGGWIGIERFGGFLAPSVGTKAAEGGSAQLELILGVVAVAVALLGWLAAYLLYREKSTLPARLAAALPGGYKVLANKYFVDEFYGATVVKPLLGVSKFFLEWVVDIAVLGGIAWLLAGIATLAGAILQRWQSGNLRSYAAWLAAGAAAVLLFLLVPWATVLASLPAIHLGVAGH